MTIPTAPPFTLADAERAHDDWGANCGPVALAAIMGITLDDVRPHMGDFEKKHYTNPSLMLAALRSLRRPFWKIGATWPQYGLVRIQWEGPWTQPGVPMLARYRYTHWVGAAQRGGETGIFDVNCLNNGTGWSSLADWSAVVVPYILEQYPKASGNWHITHSFEVKRDARIAKTVLSFPGDADLELKEVV